MKSLFQVKMLVYKIFPNLKQMRKRWKLKKHIREQQCLYAEKIQSIRISNRPVNVLFFVLISSNWKLESLYREMLKDSSFNPLIVVCPIVNQTREFMLQSIRDCCRDFETRGHKVVCAYDEHTDSYLDPYTLNPDIIFYTNPYEGLVDDRYFIKRFPDVLSCYVNYGFITLTENWATNLEFHNLLWAFFVECHENKRMISEKSIITGKNCIVTGYPMYDDFVLTPKVGDMWKNKEDKFQRIIWAPHHSINEDPGWIQFSSFLEIADDMLDLAEKYSNCVQFVFKPHPLLKPKLYQHADWGKQRTDAYYAKWADGQNTNISEGEYVDLFNTSDALVHDCVSFMVEYLYQKKPALYLVKHNNGSQYGKVGIDAYNSHYHGASVQDIEQFIDEVVLKGHDSMISIRESFYDKYLKARNGKLVSDNIIEYIKSELAL